ncbi:MAG: VCBS repeat-containing protein [Candidatus Hydrogenedentes bacterium]|nr:VCBS repeat-containing protein [Candidatus Hydrogenedentota bacterium]
MPRYLNSIGLLALAIVSLTARAVQPGAFAKHVVDNEFMGGYQVSVADIDSDGKPDIIALSTTPSQLVWYKNPTWERHTITTKTERNIDVAPHDIDGDGDPDLALAYEFNLEDSQSGGKVAWLECPDSPAQIAEWKIHAIRQIPTSHRVRWLRLEQDKYALLDLPIVGVGATPPDFVGPVSFSAFVVEGSPAAVSPWRSIVINDRTLELAHGMCVVQWDSDFVHEVLTASAAGVHLFDFGSNINLPPKPVRVAKGHEGTAPGKGSSEVALGVVSSQEMRFVATIEPWHGNEVVVYEIGTPATMGEERVVIDSALKDGHALGCLDVDGDGNDEIVAGGRGGEMALRIYQFAAESAEWEICVLDKGGMGAAGLVIADINQDGRQDIVAIGTATHNVAWYENMLQW